MTSPSSLAKIILVALLVSSQFSAYAGHLNRDFVIAWGDGRGKIVDNGQMITLSLDRASGSGFQSKQEYIFGIFDMRIKLVRGESAGTVTTFYLQSQGPRRDEIDLEFLGNVSGQPCILHTNIYTHGKGDREQDFYLWFDPTLDFHTYTILWNPQNIILSVDGTPIRAFKNYKSKGVSFPTKQPMRIIGALWDGESWATQGGRVKTNWSAAPFTAYFRNFGASACVWPSRTPCHRPCLGQGLDMRGHERLKWVQKHYMIYNYCNDRRRYRGGVLPPECTLFGGL